MHSWVEVRDGNGHVVGSGIAMDGRFEIGGVLPGDVFVSAGDESRVSERVRAHVRAGAHTEVELVIQP